ncbi:MAG: hypothetical protein ACK5PB_20965 [Pirellula sp.]|jgi:hypothetical protein
MDSQKPEINELISGLLDGYLSIEESKKLAEESSKNPQVERDTESLAALRSSLLRGRPTGKLGDNFAVRVMEAAKSRAAALGEDAPEWIETGDVVHKPVPFDPAELKSRWVVPAMSVLATCVLAFLFTKLTLVYNETLESQRQEEIAAFNKKQLEQDLLAVFENSTNGGHNSPESGSSSSIVGNLLDESQKRTNPGEGEQPTESKDKRNAVAAGGLDGEKIETKNESQTKEMPAADALANNSAEAGVKSAANLPDSPKVADSRPTSNSSDASNMTVAANSSKESKPINPLQRATGKMMAVYEVTVDRVAKDNDLINVYLQKHGLGSVEDLVLGDSEIASVLKSGIVGPADSQGDSQVLVLKGTASMLSEFYDDLLRSYEDFPGLRMNAVMDDSVGMIEQQMKTMMVTDTKGAVGRLGSSGSSGLVSTFSTGSSKFFDIPLEQRRLEKRREPGRDLNPISYVILIVRTPD